MTLVLREYNGRAAPGRLSVFRDVETALEHLCDHVLTWPEGEGWADILPTYRDRIGIARPKARFLFATNLWKEAPPGSSCQWLYDEYADAIVASVDSTTYTGWTWIDPTEPRDTLAFGPSGVLVIFTSSRVRTAYLPGRGTPFIAEEGSSASFAGRSRVSNPLPRESSRTAEGKPEAESPSRGMRRNVTERSGRGSAGTPWEVRDEERLERRYHIFKDCARAVRKVMRNALYRERGRRAQRGPLEIPLLDLEKWEELVGLGAGRPQSQDDERKESGESP